MSGATHHGSVWRPSGLDGAAARLAVIWIALLLAGCGSVAGDARLGPNPGGGFYGAPNLNVGRVNP